jgi:tetratricopeptide (TPR) repeat protein
VDFDDAVKEYDKALSYDSTLASAYYNRGTIMYRMGCFDKAVQDMEKATTLCPGNEEFQIGLQRSKAQLFEEKSKACP